MVMLDTEKLDEIEPVTLFSIDVQGADDLWRAIRKLSNENALVVVMSLSQKGPLARGELQELTLLSSNSLNHALYEMQQLDLIIKNKSDKRYYLTAYCKIILGALEATMNEIERNRDMLTKAGI
jgi:DNA-binding HxlR family transcriptional regulator